MLFCAWSKSNINFDQSFCFGLVGTEPSPYRAGQRRLGWCRTNWTVRLLAGRPVATRVETSSAAKATPKRTDLCLIILIDGPPIVTQPMLWFAYMNALKP